jgi:flagellin
LSIADGLQANISALTQSAQNVTDGVGLLQTADGALSQVTTLLNRAVTLATEAANSGLTQGPGSQQAALQNEFASITAEINQIGSNTTYNNTPVFSGSQMSVFLSDGSAADSKDPNISVNMPTLSSSSLGLATYATGTLDLTSNPTSGNTVQIGSQTYTFVAAGQANAANDVALGSNVQSTLQNLQAAVNGGAGAGNLYGTGTAVNQQATITSVNGGSAVVQALQAGTAGNSVSLATSITSNVGSGGGVTLTGGKNATFDT